MLVNNNEGKRTQKIKRLEVSQNPSPKEKWFFSKKPSPINMKIGSTAVTINQFWGCESERQEDYKSPCRPDSHPQNSLIVTAVLPIIILIGLGFLLKNHFFFGEGFWDTSNRLIFSVLFPSLLFTSMSRAELAQLPTGGMAVAVIPAILTVAFLTLVVQKTYPMDTRGFTSIFQGSIRLNTYLGLVIAGGVMGAKELENAAYTAAVMITLVNFLSVVSVERFVGMNSGWWSLLKFVLANPLILACVLGMVFSIFI